jgi:hypothetical protein
MARSACSAVRPGPSSRDRGERLFRLVQRARNSIADRAALSGWTESRRRGRPSGTSPHGARRGVAWLTLVLGLRWQLRTKAVAALSGLATLALAGAVAIGDAAHGEDNSFPGILLVSIELSAEVLGSHISVGSVRGWGWTLPWRPR